MEKVKVSSIQNFDGVIACVMIDEVIQELSRLLDICVSFNDYSADCERNIAPEPILSWNDDEYNSVDEESNDRPRGEVVKPLWVKMVLFRKDGGRSQFFDYYRMGHWSGKYNYPYTHIYRRRQQYTRQYFDNLFSEEHSDRSTYGSPNECQ
ncbi:hypothetical protein RF11_11844 [Thelohanellus kitauei]|uniref:Uncharacterized protein n=1 Tax=Thelohanellus kitauei TaxID=669202 RepID=A0A0C2NFT1_THEKT|nr:hypothetical protein RF11_11844 [Thelohanellus kitauei]